MSHTPYNAPLRCPHGHEKTTVGACVDRYLDVQHLKDNPGVPCYRCRDGARVRYCFAHGEELPKRLKGTPR